MKNKKDSSPIFGELIFDLHYIFILKYIIFNNTTAINWEKNIREKLRWLWEKWKKQQGDMRMKKDEREIK